MTRHDSDRGAALIHVAVIFIGLFLFSGFVVDYGTFWVSRGQAQNAADAGALSGAVARLYDDTSSPPASTTSGKVYDSVVGAVANNYVWGISPPANTVNLSYTCPDATTNCVAVDVYRDGTNSSTALPTFFLKLVNVNSQGVKAHAVAEAVAANATGCMRPWFLADAGWVTPAAYGTVVALHSNVAPSGYFQLDMGNGGKGIEDAIEQCATLNGSKTVTINDLADANTKPGGTEGPEAHGVAQLFQWDECNGSCSDATVTGTGPATQVTGGCAASTGGCVCTGNPGSVCPNGAHISPRVVTVALCDPAQPSCASGGAANKSITITNFLSFFVTGCGGIPNSCSPGGGDVEIDAVLIGTAGLSVGGGGTPIGNDSFVRAVVLIR